MDDAVRLIAEQQVGEQMRRGQRSETPTVAGKRLRLTDTAGGVAIYTPPTDTETRDTIQTLLSKQKEITMTTGDPRRVFSVSPKETCGIFAETLERFVESRPDWNNRRECIYDVETWRLLLALLDRMPHTLCLST